MRICFYHIIFIFFTGSLIALSAPEGTCQPLNRYKNDTIGLLSVSPGYHPGRVLTISGTGLGLYTGALTGLNSLWYKDYPRSSFHFFKDYNEWLQTDKAGHIYTSYILGLSGIEACRWAGLPGNKAIWYGGLYGSFFLTTVELLDGFSAQWGASPSDFYSNTLGSALVIGQELIWQEQRFQLKFSWFPQSYPNQVRDRVAALYGTTFPVQLLKDYNAQSYWLSANIYSFLDPESNFPKWLNVSLGYSAANMLGAKGNNFDAPLGTEYVRYRQYLFSLDVDLTRINTSSRFLNFLFGIVNYIKFPAPAIEYNTKGELKLYPVYF